MSHRGLPSRFVSEVAPPELLSRIRGAVAAADAAKTATRLRVIVAVVVVLLVCAAALLLTSQLFPDRPALRVDLATHPTSQLLIVLLLVVGLTLSATLVAVGRGERGLGPDVMSLLLVALIVTPIYAVLTLASPPRAGEASATLPAELSPWGAHCLALAATVGVLVLISLTAALRRSVPVASRLRGATLGATAGAWAGLTVFIYCPATEFRHVLVGHALPIAAFTLLGLAVIPRALRP